MLALTAETRRWEPRRLACGCSQPPLTWSPSAAAGLRFTARWPWTDVITRAIERLAALPNRG